MRDPLFRFLLSAFPHYSSHRHPKPEAFFLGTPKNFFFPSTFFFEIEYHRYGIFPNPACAHLICKPPRQPINPHRHTHTHTQVTRFPSLFFPVLAFSSFVWYSPEKESSSLTSLNNPSSTPRNHLNNHNLPKVHPCSTSKISPTHRIPSKKKKKLSPFIYSQTLASFPIPKQLSDVSYP